MIECPNVPFAELRGTERPKDVGQSWNSGTGRRRKVTRKGEKEGKELGMAEKEQFPDLQFLIP